MYLCYFWNILFLCVLWYSPVHVHVCTHMLLAGIDLSHLFDCDLFPQYCLSNQGCQGNIVVIHVSSQHNPGGYTPFHWRRFVAARFVASHFIAKTLCRQPFCRGGTLPPVILSLGHFISPPFRCGTLGQRRMRMTNEHLKFIIQLHECILYTDSIIYLFICIYYSLVFIHTALFIHTVSVTGIYKCMATKCI